MLEKRLVIYTDIMFITGHIKCVDKCEFDRVNSEWSC